ncbi:HSP20-like chaperone [Conidiobolus coronatus NRRL 28638]|uniref:HSP20-like chaperone n=1 Tax=Conidiobolus coronatus (strain ATCC 28846 / CBS 209.66 / NRRL 28638) TaxID=796925 RepID=A0A137P6J1_CONC2|nr:HSP20-like chaperone [Conidiobolus coronatus NRRL 28638]|eukprot:KXN70640.1 HSP20-like chaperone [Conidiobolus coronatus NRRL 28638]
MSKIIYHPSVLWAQRTNEIYLTIELSDIKDEKFDLTATSLKFSGTSEEKPYEFEIEFFNEIDPELSRRAVTARSIFMVLRKYNSDQEYWPRLQKEKGKLNFLKTDFDRWIDEDEQDEKSTDMNDMNFMDFSQMGANFPNPGDDYEEEERKKKKRKK